MLLLLLGGVFGCGLGWECRADPQFVALVVGTVSASPRQAAAYAPLTSGTSLPAGGTVRTANGRVRLVWEGFEAIVLMPSGELAINDLHFARGKEATAGFVPVNSALNPILTPNEAHAGSYDAQPAAFDVTLSQGGIFVFLTAAHARIHFSKGLLETHGASFSINSEKSGCIRITVSSGTATIYPTSGKSIEVGSAQFVRLCGQDTHLTVSGPGFANDDPEARHDFAILHAAQPEAIVTASNGLNPGGVGDTFSAPFDIKPTPAPDPSSNKSTANPTPAPDPSSHKSAVNHRATAILGPANPPNITAPVNSPEQP